MFGLTDEIWDGIRYGGGADICKVELLDTDPELGRYPIRRWERKDRKK